MVGAAGGSLGKSGWAVCPPLCPHGVVILPHEDSSYLDFLPKEDGRLATFKYQDTLLSHVSAPAAGRFWGPLNEHLPQDPASCLT